MSYLPIDMDAGTLEEVTQAVPDMKFQCIDENDTIATLQRLVKLEECRSSSYRNSWHSERIRSRAALLKLRILMNSKTRSPFEYAIPDRIFSQFWGRTEDDYLIALKNERRWSTHYFRKWMNERSQRKKLELEVLLLF